MVVRLGTQKKKARILVTLQAARRCPPCKNLGKEESTSVAHIISPFDIDWLSQVPNAGTSPYEQQSTVGCTIYRDPPGTRVSTLDRRKYGTDHTIAFSNE